MCKYFTEEEAQELVMENEIERIAGDSGRWTQHITSICELEGKYYEIYWSRGLTESQENEYDSATYPEVKKVHFTKAKSYYVWQDVTVENKEKDVLIENIESLKLVGDEKEIEKELSVLSDVDLVGIKKILEKIDLLNLDDDMQDANKVAIDYLNKLNKVKVGWEEL